MVKINETDITFFQVIIVNMFYELSLDDKTDFKKTEKLKKNISEEYNLNPDIIYNTKFWNSFICSFDLSYSQNVDHLYTFVKKLTDLQNSLDEDSLNICVKILFNGLYDSKTIEVWQG